LTELTRPGPFGPRTIELGSYFGCFEGNRLVAMAGERMHAGSLREVSGVCTHPDFQGKGLARRLMMKLIRQELLRGETPFLHVMSENLHARALYERMGFRNYRETIVRVISQGSHVG
jgi:predicted GNAT family acetyltransferase